MPRLPPLVDHNTFAGVLATITSAYKRLATDPFRSQSQGVEGVRETICDANYDLNSCRAYAEDAVGVDRQATEALEWIKKKYLVKANGWKRDLEGVKLGRERIAEELREGTRCAFPKSQDCFFSQSRLTLCFTDLISPGGRPAAVRQGTFAKVRQRHFA